MTEKKEVNWIQEIMSSFVVFLVALPLCMGIAIASGTPPALGLISGIVGGLVVSSLAGSPLQVSGPAAGLAVIIWELVNKYGLVSLGVIVLIAGLIQVLAGWFKLGRWFRAVSPAVVHGMLGGIGVLIFGSQFHVMVDDKPRATGIENLLSIPEAIYKGILPVDGSQHHLAAAIGLTTIVVLVLWNIFKPKKMALLPAPLLAIIVAIGVAAFFQMPIQYVSIQDNILNATNMPKMEAFKLLLNPSFFVAAVALAIVASAESLLCATATDQLHDEERTDYDRELMAQGVGNIVCGVLGALPVTGVIVRSSANIESGAKTRFSGFLHGVWLLAFIVALPFVIRLIPRSALAALLVYIGYKLVNVKVIRELWATSKSELGIYVVTVIAIVSTNLLTGILIGLSLSAAKLIYTFSHLELETTQEDDRYDIFAKGAATFIRLPLLAESLESLPRTAEIHLHIGDLSYIDHACIELLESWGQQMERSGGQLIVEWDALQKRFARKPLV